MRRDNLDHIDIGHILGQQALKRHHAASEHRNHTGEFDIVLACKAHQRGEKLSDIQVLKVKAGKIGHDEIKVRQEGGVVERGGIATRDRKSHQRILELGDIALGNGKDHVFHDAAVMTRHAPNHAQVYKVDDTVFKNDVARMRIGMEKAIVEHLRGIVLHNLPAYLLQVVTLRA